MVVLPRSFPEDNEVFREGSSLPVAPALLPLLPEGLSRGIAAGVAGTAATSFLFTLLAEPLQHGSWAAIAGAPALGLESAEELGVPLERLVLVPGLASKWLEVVAGLIDACEIVVVVPPRCLAEAARRLVARARERRSLFVVFSPSWCQPVADWPEPLDLRFSTTVSDWVGLGSGDGTLQSREVEVVLSGRRMAGRDRKTVVTFPMCSGDASMAVGRSGKLSALRSAPSAG